MLVAWWLAAAGGAAVAAPPRELSKAEYVDRLRAMWLGESVANWTGLKTEGRRSVPPFLTDADWNTTLSDFPPVFIDFVLTQDPWRADDDTDIEYVYLHLLTEHAPATRLTADQIRDGWMAHCNRAIWVSNDSARRMMNLGARPPGTALGQAMSPPYYADLAQMIDAQLTTEFFGALAPGMPEVALDLADLPIGTTAAGYAAHASQFHVVLYSLATQVDRTLPPADQAVWLVREARKFIPDSSKSADICDFVLADYLANPDKSDWELTRDRVYERYQLNAAANGFVYRAWYESSVNFATGVIALLYGEMDFARTVRIGTLSGWDSDNGTATMGGLLGLILGTEELRAQFPGWTPSDRYWAARTRDNLPDHLPADPDADDTLTRMAERMMPIVERVVVEAGGLASSDRWLLPPGGAGDGLTPAMALGSRATHALTMRSANVQVPLMGGTVTPSTNVPGTPTVGSWWIPYICDGLENDFRGQEIPPGSRGEYSTQRPVPAVTPEVHTLSVSYSVPVHVHTIRFVESSHYPASGGYTYVGGWFESATVEVFVGGQWIAPQAQQVTPLDATIPFQIIDFVLAEPALTTGVRITGVAGGPSGQAFVTCADLDALAPPLVAEVVRFDLSVDGAIDAEDLYRFFDLPRDLNRDAAADATDAAYLQRAVRWGERVMGGR